MITKQQHESNEAAKQLGLRHVEQWSGDYRGINFAIKRHVSDGSFRGSHNAWTYYLYVNKQNFTAEDWAKILTDPFKSGYKEQWHYSGDALGCCDFHCGVTWFDVKCQPCDTSNPLIEVGCDYSHYWDEEAGYPYDLEWVLRDVKNSIDKLHENFTVFVWSKIDGTFHLESEIAEYNKVKRLELWPEAKVSQ